MFDKRSLNLYAVITGVFFIISGTGKLMDISGFSNLIYQYGFGSLKMLAPVIAVTEIMLGLLLVLLINPKRHALFAFILLLFFTLAFAYGHFKHGVNNCGCFGTLQPEGISPAFSFIRNFILLGISLLVWIKYPKEKVKIFSWKKLFIFFAWGITAFIAGLTSKAPFILNLGSGSVFNYNGQDVKNTALAKYIKASPGKRYLVFCFSYGCPHCWNSMANLGQYKKTGAVDSIIALAVGDSTDKHFFYLHFNPGFNARDLNRSDMDKLTDRYPTAFYIAHDTIKVFLQAELPSVVTFQKYYSAFNSP